MVRLINIIRQNLKKSAPSEPVNVSAPPQSSGFVPSKENPFQKRAKPSGEPAVAPAESVVALKEIYLEVYNAAQCAVGGILDKSRIENTVAKVAAVFKAEPYSALLLMAYSFSKKSYLPAHITNDVIMTVAFAQFLGFDRDEIVGLGICALCHDLGMSNFDDISRKGQQLTQQEIEDIKQHPLRSAEIVRPVFAERVASVVLDVHERENGQGYPRGIPGAEIHLWAKIIAVVDTFEALTHPRVFRSAYIPYEALKMIIKKKDILFDDAVVKRFIDFMSVYPVGSLVTLNSGEVAVVTGSNPGSPTRPQVRLVLNEHHEVEENLAPVSLEQKEFIYITGVVAPDKERELLYYLKPRGQVDLDEV